jgi:hypothetical protein
MPTEIEGRARAAQSTGCCPPFDPAPYQDREVTFHDAPFVKEHVLCLWHVPIGMGRAVTRALAAIDAADARPEVALMLSEDASPWGSDLYIAVTKPVPGATMASLSGTFLTRVYEGPYSRAPEWAADMAREVAARGRTLERLYFGYTTCPRCAKAYGKNYVVLFARVAA